MYAHPAAPFSLWLSLHAARTRTMPSHSHKTSTCLEPEADVGGDWCGAESGRMGYDDTALRSADEACGRRREGGSQADREGGSRAGVHPGLARGVARATTAALGGARAAAAGGVVLKCGRHREAGGGMCHTDREAREEESPCTVHGDLPAAHDSLPRAAHPGGLGLASSPLVREARRRQKAPYPHSQSPPRCRPEPTRNGRYLLFLVAVIIITIG